MVIWSLFLFLFSFQQEKVIYISGASTDIKYFFNIKCFIKTPPAEEGRRQFITFHHHHCKENQNTSTMVLHHHKHKLCVLFIFQNANQGLKYKTQILIFFLNFILYLLARHDSNFKKKKHTHKHKGIDISGQSSQEHVKKLD